MMPLNLTHDAECVCNTCFDARQQLIKKTTRLDQLHTDKWRGCPCLMSANICHPQCSCARPYMSAGCRRCATYGSIEQRKWASENLAKILDRHYAHMKFLYGLDVEGIVKWVNQQLAMGQIETVARALEDIYPRNLNGNTMVAWLSCTWAAKEQLGESREVFIQMMLPDLIREFGTDRVSKIMSRLG